MSVDSPTVPPAAATSGGALRANIIGYDNRAGLGRDIRLLERALAAAGLAVQLTRVRNDRAGRRGPAWTLGIARLACGLPLRRPRHPRYDVNIMIERIRPLYFTGARVNVLLANPDWFKDSDREHLAAVDAVLVKSRCAKDIFERLGRTTLLVGFTSEDRLLPEVPRERAFFHLAGHSENKGTAVVLQAWRRRPDWPKLTIVQRPGKAQERVVAPNIDHVVEHVADERLRVMQNGHLFHLCPSETESFGHYIVEALSVGAVTLTVDGAPMNEIVTPERGLLIPAARTGQQRLATTYFVDAGALESAVDRALALGDAERRAIGARARAWFEENDREFGPRTAAALGTATRDSYRGQDEDRRGQLPGTG